MEMLMGIFKILVRQLKCRNVLLEPMYLKLLKI